MQQQQQRQPTWKLPAPVSAASTSGSTPPSIRQCYLCGGLSAVSNVTVSFPLNKIVFRQQLENIPFRVAADQVLRAEFWTLYRGALPPLLQRVCNLSAMFGCYSALSACLASRFPEARADATRAASACLAGVCEAVFMPFERVQTLLQLSRHRNQNHHHHHRMAATFYRGTLHAFAELRARHGVSEWYRGLSAVFLRNSCSTGLYFVLKERAQQRTSVTACTFRESFVIGAGLGALISTLVYPLNVAKSHMQAIVGGQSLSLAGTLRRIYLEGGVRRIFRGAPANLCRAAVSWGIVTASYDFFASILAGAEVTS